MRTINELLQLGLDNFDDFFCAGICIIYADLYDKKEITWEELYAISEYLKLNLPTKKYGDDRFSWEPEQKKPRIAWLKEHIELTKLDTSQ